jgi:hypothetical protein
MTDAEPTAKWRAKHARRLARKARYVPGPFTAEQWDDLILKPDDLEWEE